MSPSRVLRIFRFRLAAPDFDADLRGTLLPGLAALPGVLDVYAGRRDQPNPDEHLVASVWSDRAAMVRALGESIERSPFHPELRDLSTDRRLDVCDVAFGDRAPATIAPAAPAVLRLVEGRVRPGELRAYLDEAERGMVADRAAGHGPIAFYLGCGTDDTFVTLSVWPDWATIETATGGDIHRPIATRHAERLVAWTGSHFELVEAEER